MKVILLTDIPKVGNKYDVKEFKEGYAQNVLLSKGLAELASPQALLKLEARKNQISKKKEAEQKAFEVLVSIIDKSSIVIKVKTNEKGHLFKAIHPRDVVEAIKKSQGIDIEESSIHMPAIKEVGIHKISIKKGEREGFCTVTIVAEK